MTENEYKKLFEKDNDDRYIRLIIPSDFVKLFLKDNKEINLIGKKDLDLTTDEIIILKRYIYELKEKMNNKISK